MIANTADWVATECYRDIEHNTSLREIAAAYPLRGKQLSREISILMPDGCPHRKPGLSVSRGDNAVDVTEMMDLGEISRHRQAGRQASKHVAGKNVASKCVASTHERSKHASRREASCMQAGKQTLYRHFFSNHKEDFRQDSRNFILDYILFQCPNDLFDSGSLRKSVSGAKTKHECWDTIM